MRYLLAVLVVLAMTVVSFGAEPKPVDPALSAWKVTLVGPDPKAPAPQGTVVGNPKTLEVFAGTSLTRVRGFAIDDLFGPGQDGTSQRDAEAWFTLSFCGSKLAVNQKWQIYTRIYGKGFASAGQNVGGHAWGESVQVIEYSGDNSNIDYGQLAVTSSGSAGITIGLPATFHVTLEKETRSLENDLFDVKSENTTRGPGKLCRVKVGSHAKAHVSAKAKLGAATASLEGYLRGDLTMKGFCSIGGKEYEDSFDLSDDDGDSTYTLSKVDPPRGGMENETGPPPPTIPSDEERGIPPKPAEPTEEEAKPADPADGSGTSTPSTEEEAEPADPANGSGTSTPSTEEEAEPADPADGSGTSTPESSGGTTGPDDTPEDTQPGG